MMCTTCFSYFPRSRLTKKLLLVPSEQFISVLDENVGSLVHIHQGHKEDEDDLVTIADEVNCDGVHFQCLAKKCKAAMDSAKFNLLLACTPKYIEYEGVWRSCKESPSLFKEDLRFLFTLLGQGSLKPNVTECIGLEEVAGAQDRIELVGNEGIIVCLPTALYEKKVQVSSDALSLVNSTRNDRKGFLVESNDDNPADTYASDSGYGSTSAHDTLSDFHDMHDTKQCTSSLPVLPEATSYSHTTNMDHRTRFGAVHRHSSLVESTNQRQDDASSMISSVSHGSYANASTTQTALSDSALRATKPSSKEDPPSSIQFRIKQTRRYRAYQRQFQAKERWKKSQVQQQQGDGEEKLHPELDSQPSQEKPPLSPQSYSARKAARRREARMRGQTSTETRTSVDVKPDIKAAHDETEEPNEEQTRVNAREESKSNKRTHEVVRRAVHNYRSHDAQSKSDDKELQESRNEDESARDAANSDSFNAVMNKWRNINNE